MKDLRPDAQATSYSVHIKGGMTYVAEYFWRKFV